MGNRSSKRKSVPSTSRRRGDSPPSTSRSENSQPTSRTTGPDLENLDFSEITEPFECCICHLIIFSEIVQCKHGHNFCPSHSSLLKNCPICPTSQSSSDDLPPENLSSSKMSENSFPPSSFAVNSTSGKSPASTSDKSSENSSRNCSPANSTTENSEEDEEEEDSDMSPENTPPQSPSWSSYSEDEDSDREKTDLCQYVGDGCPYRSWCRHITAEKHEPNCEYRQIVCCLKNTDICSNTKILFREYINHLRSTHHVKVVNECEHVHKYFVVPGRKFVPDGAFSTFIMEAFDEEFIVRVEELGDELKQVFIWVIFHGRWEDGYKFKAKIQLCNSDLATGNPDDEEEDDFSFVGKVRDTTSFSWERNETNSFVLELSTIQKNLKTEVKYGRSQVAYWSVKVTITRRDDDDDEGDTDRGRDDSDMYEDIDDSDSDDFMDD